MNVGDTQLLRSRTPRKKGNRAQRDPLRDDDTNRTLLQDTLFSALFISEATKFASLEDDIKAQFGEKNPVSCLTEMGQYLRATVNFVEVGQPQGPSHSPRFTMNAVVGGHPYSRVEAGNKKDCRIGAAYVAWKAILQEQQTKFRDVCAEPDPTFDDAMTALSHLEYLKLVERNPAAFCGRKILATFIVKRKQKKGKRDIMRVVSLATGNRCILSQYLTTDGTVINDSHAEVLARRSLLRFLLKELENFKPSNPDSIYEQSNTGKAKLKNSMSLHLYISTAPCGDAALFARTERDLLDYKGPIFMNNTHGVLRTKIESGEGCIPVDPDFSQSLLGLKFGKRLRTMSCSDKICKWNVVGVQGSLLTQFIDPVYITSVTIGNNYVFGHVSRALNYRLGKDHAHYEPSIFVNPPYRPAMPLLGHSELDQGIRETENTSATCVAWNCGTDIIDIFDGVRGRGTEGPEEGRTPSICKKEIYHEFRKLCSKLKQQQIILGQTYYESKQKAIDYQKSKVTFYSRMQELGYGTWVTKPVELDYFA